MGEMLIVAAALVSNPIPCLTDGQNLYCIGSIALPPVCHVLESDQTDAVMLCEAMRDESQGWRTSQHEGLGQ